MLGNMADALLAQGNLPQAVTLAQDSLRIVEEIGATTLVSSKATTLALIHASGGDFSAALTAVETACAQDCPMNNAAAQAVRGIVLLRLGHPAEARVAFQAAIATAKAVPGYDALYEQLDALGTAHCGLALTQPEQRQAQLQAAHAAFAAARAITAAPGIVAGVQRQLALLAAGLEGLAAEGVKP